MIEDERNLAGMDLTVVVMVARSNDMDDRQPLMPRRLVSCLAFPFAPAAESLRLAKLRQKVYTSPVNHEASV